MRGSTPKPTRRILSVVAMILCSLGLVWLLQSYKRPSPISPTSAALQSPSVTYEIERKRLSAAFNRSRADNERTARKMHAKMIKKVPNPPEGSVECDPVGNAGLPHHPLLKPYRCAKVLTQPEELLYDFTGQKILNHVWYWLGNKGKAPRETGPEVATASLPPQTDSNYLEYLAIAAAVADADKQFTMIEMGAGFGRWLIDAYMMAKQWHSKDFHVQLVGCEAESTHYRYLLSTFALNNINPMSHYLFNAAVWINDAQIPFMDGMPDHNYGQMADSKLMEGMVPVKAISLHSLISPHYTVDLIDSDAQGAEEFVFEPAKELLRTRVKRVLVEIHDPKAMEAVYKLFVEDLQWSVELLGMPGYPLVSKHMNLSREVEDHVLFRNPAFKLTPLVL